ncbi:hypothetical protein SAMN02745121_08765 [Nannocystis exedens]|uniref:Uncharacterized protein n=1 Tax=Nannocystis exedens TaxID=54 RepID=A0A1I2IIY0_9BACT|nr:hypothetical protein NAEX_02328 [Nannocystis exedens]SFF42299.1 hypothetical protein SAMN02745121_08765 [Nannocystis exedens]
MRNAPMIALSALCFLFGCKNPGGDDSTSSSTGGGDQCTEGFEGGPEVDPSYPACGCLPERCEDGGGCIPSGFPVWTSSVCLPKCSTDTDCPPMSGKPATCSINGYCEVACVFGTDSCPADYVCSESNLCQVDLRGD